MTGYIEEQAGEGGAGNWDIATVPGGGGNWGGSFLAVPDGERAPGAWPIELVQFLTSADGQLAAFEAVGNLPSQPDPLRGPGRQGRRPTSTSTTHPSARSSWPAPSSLEPVYLGAKNQPVRDAVENALRSVESGETSVRGRAGTTAVEDAEAAAAG